MSEKKNLLVFAGAGASVLLGYPTTKEFLDKVDEGFREHALYKIIPEEYKEDVEKVLWFIQDNVLDPISAHLIGNPFLNQHLFEPQQQTLGGAMFSTATFYKEAENLKKYLNKKVHSLYGVDRIKTLHLGGREYWVGSLINDKSITDSWNMEIFTTNYDRAIEKAFEDSGIDSTFTDPFLKSDFNRVLDVSHYRGWGFSKDHPWLTKLHGSLEWKKEERGLIEKSFEGFSDKSSVLYPGFKGEPEEEPFKQFHHYFAACLQKCDAFLSIGFSYRDEYINKLIKENFKGGAHLYIIDPSAEEITQNGIWRNYITCRHGIGGECNKETMDIFKKSIKRHFR